MVTHVKVLAVLFIALSALALLAAFMMMAIFGLGATAVGTSGDPDAALALPFIGITGIALVVFFLAMALPGFIAGWGLLKFRPWARILAIVFCAINLINIPFGTILGIYGLWVLLNAETEQLFKASAPPATI